MAASQMPMGHTDSALVKIEAALFHIRRVWAKPEIIRKLRDQGLSGRPVQTSSLLVVYAVAQLSTDDDGCGAPPPAERAEDVTVGAVAERLSIDPSTASRLVGHAIAAGFVARRPSPRDARRANLQLTDAGWRLKTVADRFRRAYLAELLADWTEAERTEFARLLTRFTRTAVRTPMSADAIEKIRGGDQ
ncbi:MAG TPA: MarR family winged helix-turn-helix transcriptional regulator [Streptosporangiaceae bacterium]|nr:MarR family winged helix-turn-helix transcriptional regulator [Streptosporangiaceae bacterium]